MTPDVQPPPARLLVVMPTWVGDAVMAIPAVRALQRRWPSTLVTLLARRDVTGLLRGVGGVRLVSRRPRDGLLRLASRLRAGRFDSALLLPNSFRWAAVVRAAGIARRIGYDRDGRGLLLTDKILPRRSAGRFEPVPAVSAYLDLAAYLGADVSSPDMRLDVSPRGRTRADRLLRDAGLDGAFVLLNPGARYGAAKLWPVDRYADLARRLAADGHAVAVNVAPGERWITQLMRDTFAGFVDLSDHKMTLSALPEVCRRAGLVVTNDTGPRHVAAAAGTPVVTLFGPTDPRWTTLRGVVPGVVERELIEPVWCGPCQKKTCPLDHRCMTRLTVDRVYEEARRLLPVGVGA